MKESPTSPLQPLAYETEYVEERLPDETLRLTVISDRGRGMKAAIACAGIGTLSSMLLLAIWLVTGSLRAAALALAVGPLTILLAIAAFFIQCMSSQRQTHVVEVSPKGLMIQTFMAGDPVTRRHARSEILAVQATDLALEIHTTKDACSCMVFAKPQHLKAVAELLNRELSLDAPKHR